MTKLFVAERRDEILDYLNKQLRITVKELAENLHVSEATLRTDLNDMDKDGLLKRTHGGAILNDYVKPENSFYNREKQNRDEKVYISTKAEQLVNHGQCILLDEFNRFRISTEIKTHTYASYCSYKWNAFSLGTKGKP